MKEIQTVATSEIKSLNLGLQTGAQVANSSF